MFESIKAMKDIVSAGIDAYKASEHLDAVVKEAKNEYKEQFTDDEKALWKQVKSLKKEHDAVDTSSGKEAQEKANALLTEVEKAEMAFLMALSKNKDLPKEFRKECKAAVTNYIKTNDDAPVEILEKYLMKAAKTDEERESVHQMIEEAMAGE